MSDRHRVRARSPMRDPARASLQSFNYGTYPELHAIPTRREIVQSPRTSTSNSLLTPVITTTYKITPEVAAPARTPHHHRANSTSRPRRSTLESSTQRPAIINAPLQHRVVQQTARPPSPLSNPMRSSDETGEFYAIPASSKHRSHRHRPSYSATIDNSEMSRVAKESAPERLARTGSGREGTIYSRSKPRQVAPSALVRHPDKMSDDYGENGYGYTNPRDVVEYDLARGTPKYYDDRRNSYNSKGRPTSINGIADIAPRYDNRGGPPPSTRGFERIPRQPQYEELPRVRMPSVERSSNRAEPVYEDRKRRPVSLYQQDERPRHRERDDYRESRDPRDDDLRQEPKRTDRYEKSYEDDVERRGFGIRTDRPEKYDNEPKIHDKRHEHDRRDDRRSGRNDDYDDRRDDRKDKKSSGGSGRDVLAAALSIGGAALGINSLAKSGKEDSDERDSDDKEGSRRKKDDEQRRRRERDDEPREKTRHRDERDRDDRDRRERRDKEPEAIDLSGRNPQEKRSSKEQREFTPPSSREDSPPSGDAGVPRSHRIAAAPAFNPKDTTDLRALKEALNRQDDQQKEAVPIPIRSSTTPAAGNEVYGSSFDPRDPSSLSNIKAELRAHEQSDATTSRQRQNSFLPPEVAPSEADTSISIVSPPEDDPSISSKVTNESRPVKGILRPPREKFPEEANPIREGVAPLKDSKKDGIPPDARWTRISRSMVNPEALELGKERYEARPDSVIVLRVLSKEEVQGYAEVTQKIRQNREDAIALEEEEEHRRRRRDRHQRHAKERRSRDGRDRDDRDGGHGSSSHHHREHRDRDGRDRHDDRNDRDRERDRHHSSHSESDTTEDEYVDLGRSRGRDGGRDKRGVAFDEPKNDLGSLKENGDGTYTGYVRNPPPAGKGKDRSRDD